MRRRPLRPEEDDLWQAVARSARPMHAAPVAHRPLRDLPAAIVRDAPPPALPLPAFRVGEKVAAARRTDALAPLTDRHAAAAPRMDAKAFTRMSRGKLVPEATIDLHGLTLAEAHPDLIRFILNAHSAGLRLVLVITGKGKRGEDDGPVPQRHGVLKHQAPHWMTMAPVAPLILQVAEAHLKHGGTGAYYVYLRRQR